MARRGIYKRGNIYWIHYADIDGTMIRESTKSDKFKIAEAKLLDRKDSVKKGKSPEIIKVTNCTFNQLADKYSEWMEARHRSALNKKYVIGTGKMTKRTAKKPAINMREAFGNLPLRHFTTLLVEQFQTTLMEHNLKPATINKNIGILKAMFKKAVVWQLVDEDIHKKILKVGHLAENNKRLRYLTTEEAACLVTKCDDHLRPVVTFALNTGCRLGEILSLKWDQVDLKHGFILLDITKTDSRREIPINATLRGVLQGLTRRLDVPYVFFDPATGKPYQRLKRSFPTALKRAGIRDFVFHDLRHTFASHLVMAGVDITTVSKLLGHKTLTMTLRYAHLAPAHMVKALDMLDNTLNNASQTSTAHLQHNLTGNGVAVNA